MDDPDVRERVRRYLEQNCTPSSKYMLSRLTGKGKEKVRGEGVVQIMASSANRKRLWRASPDMMRLMKSRSWLHHPRKHHTHFRRCEKRVDVCTYCHKYDKMVMPQARFKGKFVTYT